MSGSGGVASSMVKAHMRLLALEGLKHFERDLKQYYGYVDRARKIPDIRVSSEPNETVDGDVSVHDHDPNLLSPYYAVPEVDGQEEPPSDYAPSGHHGRQIPEIRVSYAPDKTVDDLFSHHHNPNLLSPYSEDSEEVDDQEEAPSDHAPSRYVHHGREVPEIHVSYSPDEAVDDLFSHDHDPNLLSPYPEESEDVSDQEEPSCYQEEPPYYDQMEPSFYHAPPLEHEPSPVSSESRTPPDVQPASLQEGRFPTIILPPKKEPETYASLAADYEAMMEQFNEMWEEVQIMKYNAFNSSSFLNRSKRSATSQNRTPGRLSSSSHHRPADHVDSSHHTPADRSTHHMPAEPIDSSHHTKSDMSISSSPSKPVSPSSHRTAAEHGGTASDMSISSSHGSPTKLISRPHHMPAESSDMSISSAEHSPSRPVSPTHETGADVAASIHHTPPRSESLSPRSPSKSAQFVGKSEPRGARKSHSIAEASPSTQVRVESLLKLHKEQLAKNRLARKECKKRVMKYRASIDHHMEQFKDAAERAQALHKIYYLVRGEEFPEGETPVDLLYRAKEMYRGDSKSSVNHHG